MLSATSTCYSANPDRASHLVRWSNCALPWLDRRERALHASLFLLPSLGPQSQPKSSCALTDHGCLEHEMEAELTCLAIRRGVSSTGASKDAVAITCAVRSVSTKQRLEPDSVGGWWIRCLSVCMRILTKASCERIHQCRTYTARALDFAPLPTLACAICKGPPRPPTASFATSTGWIRPPSAESMEFSLQCINFKPAGSVHLIQRNLYT